MQMKSSKAVVKLFEPRREEGAVAAHMKEILKALGEDPAREGLIATPMRAEKALKYLTNGYMADVQKIVGPCMVHKAKTAQDIQDQAMKVGVTVFRKGGRVTGSDYADHAEVIAPIILSGVKPNMTVRVDWDGKGEKDVNLMSTEFFMPILVTSEMATFDDFLKFSLSVNPHDLAVSIWTRSDKNLSKARRVLAGMLKENDGTDSALEWEEFGASGVGTSGNMGVGDPEGTFAIYSRRQKGRHIVF